MVMLRLDQISQSQAGRVLMNASASHRFPITPDQPCLIIAELSGNHNGDIGRARELIAAAADAGVDAVKLQTYTADTLTMKSNNPCFLIQGGPWDGHHLYDLYQEAATPWEWHEDLFIEAEKHNLLCFSTPFDPTAVDFLEKLGAPIHKVASFEITDIPLLNEIAATQKPVICSTGMANLSEIDEAVRILRTGGCPQVCLLSCISSYPAPASSMQVQRIPHLAQIFNTISGLSDHSLGHHASVAAVTMGAKIIEKHITLARADGGPDADFSMEPHEFKDLVVAVRDIEAALAAPLSFGAGATEQASLSFRKSLFLGADLLAGTVLKREHIRVIRPGHGLSPRELNNVLGRTLKNNTTAGTPLSWELLQ